MLMDPIKTLVTSVALLVGQMDTMNTMQNKAVVHLQPNSQIIESGLGGKLLELVNAPSIIHLSSPPPKLDVQGTPWLLDVKNVGPGVVTVLGTARFSVQIEVGQTAHIYSNGKTYSLRR